MKEFKLFINGKFVKSTSAEMTEFLNPCTKEVLSLIPKGSVADANNALEAAKASQHARKSLTAIERTSRVLHKMADVIRLKALLPLG